ncbi:MAG: MFS transporter, partial [Desulfobacterales bacterium]|nr:MFS transporter [Desulfobacterales bacterium]
LVAGFCTGLQFLGMSYFLLRLANPKRKSTVMAFWGTCLGVTNVIGSGAGGYFDIRGAVPFLVAAGLAFMAIWPYSRLPNQFAGGDEKQEDKKATPVWHALAAAPLLFLLSFCIGTGRSSIRGLLPVVGKHLGLDDGQSFLLLSVAFSGGLLLAIPLGWLGDRLSRRFAVAASAVALVLAAGSVALFPGANPTLWVGSFFAGGLLAASYSLAIAAVGDLPRSAGIAGLLGAFAIAGRCGAIGGNLTAGVVIDRFGGPALFWLLAACGLVILATSTRLPA